MHWTDLPADDPDVVQLAEELARVANRVIDRVFESVKGSNGKVNGPIEAPKLFEIVELRHGNQWQQDRIEAIKTTIAEAIAELPDEQLPVPGNRNHKLTWQLLGYRVYNLPCAKHKIEAQKLTGAGDGWQYSHLLESVFEDYEVGFELSTQKTRLRTLRRDLAKILIWQCRYPASSVSSCAASEQAGPSDVAAGLADYVRRPEYEEWLDQQANEFNLITLYGDTGTGKTTLAEHYVKTLEPTAARIKIRCTNEKMLEEDLGLFLEASGVAPKDINEGNKRPLFANLVRGDSHPKAVVFDDASDYEVLDFIPDDTRTKVVVTSMLSPFGRYAQCAKEIGDLNHAQAVELIERLYPPIDENEVSVLADALGHRALAINDACGLLSATDITPEQLSERLKHDLAGELDRLGDPRDKHRRRLTSVYQLAIEQLSSSPKALAVLDAFIFGPGMTQEHLAMVISVKEVFELGKRPGVLGEVRHSTDQGVSPVFAEHFPVEYQHLAGQHVPSLKPMKFHHASPEARFDASIAIRKLEALNLLRPSGTRFSMHTLTLQLLQQLRDAARIPTETRIWGIVYALLESEQWAPSHAMREEIAMWLSYARNSLITGLGGSTKGASMPPTPLRIFLVAALLQAELQYGNFGDYEESHLKAHELISETSAYLRERTDISSKVRHALESSLHYLASGVVDVHVLREFPGNVTLEKIESDAGMEFLSRGGRIKQIQRRYLWYDTEWDPIHLAMNPDLLEQEATAWARCNSSSIDRRTSYIDLRHAGEAAIWQSSHLFQRARWDDAIYWLEHAQECYSKVGGDTECTVGYLGASWRLARVHTRRGDLSTAKICLDNATKVFAERTILLDGRDPFAFDDQLLGCRLLQQEFECDFSKWCLSDFEDSDVDNNGTIVRLVEQADEIRGALARMGAGRFLPEFLTYALRVSVIAPELADRFSYLPGLSESIMNNCGELQRALTCCQRNGIAVVSLVTMADSYAEGDIELTEEQRQQYDQIAENLQADILHHVQQFNEEFDMPYWHARALACLLTLGLIDEKPATWLRSMYDQFSAASARIGRIDWISYMDEFRSGDRSPIWLLSY